MKKLLAVVLVLVLVVPVGVWAEENELEIRQAIFDEIYVPLATREIPPVLGSIKIFLDNSGYRYTIEEKSKDGDSAKILVFWSAECEESDYSVYIFLLPALDGLLMPKTISYYWAEPRIEAGWGNYSTDVAPEYDRLNMRIIGSGEKTFDAEDVFEQREFVFGE